MWPNSTGMASGACSAISSADSRGERRDRRQRKRHIEFQRRAVDAEDLGDRLADLPESLLRVDVDADRRFAGQRRAFERVGQLLGLVGVAGQFDEQLPGAVDGRRHAEVLGGQRAGPRVDQLERGDPVHVAEHAAGLDQVVEVVEPADRGDPVRRGGVQPQVERR